MKKAKKQCLGFFGLTLVAAMTIVAAHIPTPGALATSRSAVDTITVRVVGVTPDVKIRGVENNETYTTPLGEFSVDYEHIDNITVAVDYTDSQGNTTTVTIDNNAAISQTAGTKTYKIPQLEADPHAYGKYVIRTSGTSSDGIYVEDSILFYYLPFGAKITVDELTDKQYVDLDYMPYGSTANGNVSKILIFVYNENGTAVESLSPITVLAPNKRVEIPFAAKELPSGNYTLKVYGYGTDDELLYDPITLTTKYTAAVVPDAGKPDANAPDTGGLFKNLNISKEDYLVSGLIVFFVLGIVAFGVVARNKKDSKKHRR